MSEERLEFIVCDDANVVSWSALDEFALKTSGEEKSQKLPTDRFGTEYSLYGVMPPLHDPDTLLYLMELNTWHARCCKAKAHDTAGIGFELVPEGDEVEPEVQAFVDDQDIDLTLTEAMIDFESLGALALEVVRELYAPDGQPKILTHVQANTLRVHKDGNKFLQRRGTKNRWFKRFGYKADVDKDDGKEYAVGTLEPTRRATEIIWHADYSGRSDFYGSAQIIPAIGAVEGMVALRDYNIDFFRHFGVPTFAIYISGDYNLGKPVRIRKESGGSGTIGEEYDKNEANHTRTNFEHVIISTIKNHLATLAKNPHAPMILAVPGQTPESKVEIKFEKLAAEVKEASFRLYRKDNKDEILVAHGVPPYRLGIAEVGSLSGNTAEASAKMYRDSIIHPRKAMLASIVNNFFKAGFESTTKIKFNDLDLEEGAAERDLADFMFERGAMRPIDLMKIFGSKFGLELPEEADEPGLYRYYINGKPVGDSDVDEAFKSVETLLYKAAVKEASGG